MVDHVVPRFVLASASPARLALLRAGGLAPEVVVSGVDESVVTAADPVELVAELARLKCEAVAGRSEAAGAVVLGCDSMLDLDGEAFGKPGEPEVAVARWKRMRGRSGVLRTGHHLLDTRTGGHAAAVASTTVHFADLGDDEIDAYVATGEPLALAGAFAIDGRGGAFVTGVEGDPGAVVGVSLPLLRRLLTRLDLALTDLWVPDPA